MYICIYIYIERERERERGRVLNDPPRGFARLDSAERIFVELTTSDRKLKASREGSKLRNYGT